MNEDGDPPDDTSCPPGHEKPWQHVRRMLGIGEFDQRRAYRVTLPSYAEARRMRGLDPIQPGSEMAVSDLNDPIHVILHGALGEPCTICGGVPEAVCDFPLGDEGRTCDRPLCLRCSPTVGADKNYCAEHAEHGPGMLLFVPPPPPPPPSQQPTRRLPNKPPIDQRWCVMDEDGSLSGWMDQVSATRFARAYGRSVLTWDKFVALWREIYPLKKKPRKPRNI